MPDPDGTRIDDDLGHHDSRHHDVGRHDGFRALEPHVLGPHSLEPHAVVRRGTATLLQAFDRGLVDPRSRAAVELPGGRPRTDTARYWLASAAAGLVAWSEGDRRRCDDAVRTAYTLAPSKTALMFALVLRRQDRLPSSVVWLRHYLRNVDPMALSREFAMVLESVAHGAFGAAGRGLVREAVDGWLRVLADDQEAQAAQTGRWQAEIERYRPDVADAAFPLLRTYSCQWPDMAAALRGAETNRPFFEAYDALLAVRHRTSDSTEDSLDDILDALVGERDSDELPVPADTLDYLTVQTSAALHPDSIGVSTATQQIALASCVEWVEGAHSAYCADYRSRVPSRVEIVMPESRPIAGADLAVPAWQGDLVATRMPVLERSLSRHWDLAAGPHLPVLRYDFARALIWPGFACTLVLLAGLLVQPAVGAALAGVVFAAGLARAGWMSRAAGRLARHGQAVNAERDAALARLRGAGREYAEFLARFRAGDAEAERVRALIRSFGDVDQDRDRDGARGGS